MSPPIWLSLGETPGPLFQICSRRDYAGLIRFFPDSGFTKNELKPETLYLVPDAEVIIIPATADRPIDHQTDQNRYDPAERFDLIAEAVALARDDCLLVTPSVGTDHIEASVQNLDASRRDNIIRRVISSNGANAEVVAQQTVLCANLLLRPIHVASAEVAAGRFTNAGFDTSEKLNGKTWVVVGRGAQAKQMIPLLAAYNLGRVIIQSPRLDTARFHDFVQSMPGGSRKSDLSAEFRSANGSPMLVEGLRSLDAAVSQADIVSLHTRATKANVGLIDAVTLPRFKRGSVLLNLARGSLVVESAVCSALKTGHLAGFAADVLNFEAESSKSERHSELWQLHMAGEHNIVLTPHIGGREKQTIQTICEEVIRNLDARLQASYGENES